MLLPIERMYQVVYPPYACRHCGMLLQGQDPNPLHHQMIDIPPITPLVIEQRLHRLICTCCSKPRFKEALISAPKGLRA